MLTLSLREFRLKAGHYMGKLPLTLTVYGKPVATVNTLTSTIPKNTETERKPLYKEKNGWCQNHFEKGVEYALTHARYYDNEDVLILDKWVCDDCFINLVNKETTVGGKLELELTNNEWGE